MAAQTTAHLDGRPHARRDQHQEARLLVQQEQENDHRAEAAPEHWGQRGPADGAAPPPRPAHPPHACTDLQALPLCGLTVAFGLHVAEGGGLKGLWKAPEQARRPPLPAEVCTPCWEAC